LIAHVEVHTDYREPGVARKGPAAASVPKARTGDQQAKESTK
jgi:hypothetical protein